MSPGSFSLGSVAGIKITISWSFLVIFGLIIFGISGGELPDVAPGYSGLEYWSVGLAVSIVFFLALLAHELAHSLVARHYNLEVKEINLWALGGTSYIEDPFPSASSEFFIVGVGPLTSLVLGGIFLGSGVLVHAISISTLIVASLLWLAFVSFVLGVFNLIPAFPLDGGRIVHSIFWQLTGDRDRSMLWAARLGQFFGWLFVVGGAVWFFWYGDWSALWFAFIGWFVVNSSSQEVNRTELKSSLKSIRVADYMTRDPLVVCIRSTVREFLDSDLYRSDYRAFPVVDEIGRPKGIVLMSDVDEVPLGWGGLVFIVDVMCPVNDVAVVRPNDILSDVVDELTSCSVGRALVVDAEGKLVGFLTPSDIARALND